MRRWCLSVLIAVLSATPSAVAGNFQPTANGIPGEYICVLNEDVPDVDAAAADLAARNGGTLLAVWHSAVKGFWIAVPEGGARAISRDRRVQFVEQNSRVEESGTQDLNDNVTPEPSGSYTFTTDPLWHLRRISHRKRDDIDRTYAWKSAGQGVVIYIVDGGVLRFHQEWDPVVRTSPPSVNKQDYKRVEEPEDNNSAVPSDSNMMTTGTAVFSTDGAGHTALVDNLAVDNFPSTVPRNTCGPPPNSTKLIGGHPYYETDPWFDDTNGLQSHGTAVASVAAGHNVGVAKEATILPIKVNGCGDGSSVAYFVSAFDFILANEKAWATTHPRRGVVVSMSTYRVLYQKDDAINGGSAHKSGASFADSPMFVSAFESAIARVIDYGIPVVASANNNVVDACSETPARLSRHGGLGRVITVGGIGKSDDKRWVSEHPEDPNNKNPGSNYGQCVDLWAPAESINVAYTGAWDHYRALNSTGTSFSAPIVAGMLARMMAENPALYIDPLNGGNPGQVPDRLWDALAANATHLDRDAADLKATSSDLLAYLGAFTIFSPQNYAIPANPVPNAKREIVASAPAIAFASADTTCQWYEGASGNTNTPIAAPGGTQCGADSAGTKSSLCFEPGDSNCIATPAKKSFWVRIKKKVTTTETQSADSASAIVTSSPCFSISKQPHSAWAVSDQDVTLEVVVAATNPADVHYNWQKDTGSGFTGIANSDHSSITVNEKNTTLYRVVLTGNSACDPNGTVTSDVAEVRRSAPPVVKQAAHLADYPFGDASIGHDVRLTVGPDRPFGTENAASVLGQWFSGVLGDLSKPQRNVNSSWPTQTIFNPSRFQSANDPPRDYWVRLYGTLGSADSAVRVKPCANEPESIVSDLEGAQLPKEFARGGLTVLASFHLTPAPGTDFRWWQLNSNGKWQDIPANGGNGTSLVVPVPADNTENHYALEVYGGGCSVAVERVVTGVDNCPSILVTRAPDLFLFTKQQVKLEPTYRNFDPNALQPDVRWYQGIAAELPLPSTPMATGLTPVMPERENSYIVWPLMRWTCGSHAMSEVGPATMVVLADCDGYFDLHLLSSGSSFSQPFTLEAPAGGSAYRWWQRIGSAAPTRINQGVSADGTQLTVNGVQQDTSFYVEVDHTCNGSATTSTSYYYTANLCSPRPRPALPPPSPAPPGKAQTLSVDDDHDGTIFDWFVGHDYNDTSHPAGSGATIIIYPQATSYYWVRMSKVCSGQTSVTNSDFVLVEVECPIHIVTQPSPITVPIPQDPLHHPVTLSTTVEASGTEVTYEWYVNGAKSAQTGKTYTWTYTFTDPVPAMIQQRVYAVVKDSCGGSLQSQEVLLTIVNNPQRIYSFGGGGVLGRAGQGVELYVLMDPPEESQSYTYDWYRVGAPGSPDQLLGNHSSRIWVTTSHQDAFYVRVTGHYTLNGAPYDIQSLSGETYVWVNGVCDLPPLLMNQPKTDLGEYDTEGVTFVASSDWPNVHYQWYRGMTGDTRDPVNSDIGTPNKLTVGLVGEVPHPYWVRAYLPCGAHRDSATLTFTKGSCAPVLISGNPASVEIPYDGSTTLYVVADPFKNYSWYRRDDTSQPLDQHNSWLSLSNVEISGRYWARVSNTNCGGSTDSFVATVRVASCPGLDVTFPESELWALRDTSTELIVTPAAGQSVTYQWYVGEVGDDRNPVTTGGTSAILHIDKVSGDLKYWVHVTGNGCAVDSPTINVHPCDEAWVNKGTLPMEFDIAPGQYQWMGASNGGTNLTYQWYQGNVGDISTPVGEPLHDIQVNPTESTRYWVRATSHCGANTHDADSQQFLVVICPVISVQPYARDENVMPGGTTVLSADARGTKLEFRWYKGDINHPAGIGSSITTDPLTDDTTYFVVVTSDTGCPVYSEPVTVHVCHYEAYWLTSGGPARLNQPVRASISTTPSYMDGAELYWYKGVPGNVEQSSIVAYPNAVTLDLYPTPPSSTYWVRVKLGACWADSAGLTFDVCIPDITHQPENIELTDPQTPVELSVTASLGTIQWYIGEKGDISNPVPNGTTNAIHVAPANDTRYWARATGSCGRTADSESALVTVCKPPAIVDQPLGSSIAYGQQARLLVTATGTDLKYQWYQGPAGTTTTPLGTTPAIDVTPGDTTAYWAQVSGNCGTPQNSTAAIVHVCTPPAITGQPSDKTIFNGATATLAVVAAAGTSEPLMYQWYAGDPGDISAPAANGSGATFITPALTATAKYWVRVSSGAACNSADSTAATVNVCKYPQTVSISGDVNIAAGQTTRISGVSDPASSYTWYQGVSGDLSHPIRYTTVNYIDVNPTVTTQYWYQMPNGDCVSNSGTVTVNVCVPTINTPPSPPSDPVNAGSPVPLSVSASNAVSYQWYAGPSGNTSNPLVGYTSASISVNPTVTTSYWVRATGSCGVSVDSAAATVVICSTTTVTGSSPSNQWIARGNTVLLSVSATGTNIGYQWYTGNPGDTSHPITGATLTNYAATPQNTTTYWVQVKSTCGNVNSAAMTVSVCATPVIKTQPQNVQIYANSTAMLSVTATEVTTTPLSYQWYRGAAGDTSAPAGTNASTFTTPALVATTSYWVRVSNGTCTTADSTAATVTVSACPSSVAAPADVQSSVSQSVTLSVPASVVSTPQSALQLSGSSYVRVPYASTLAITGPLTVEAWIKLNTAGVSAGVIERIGAMNSGFGGYGLRVNAGKAYFFTGYDTTDHSLMSSVQGATTITAGQWHHIAGVYDGTQVRVYLDGVLDGSANAANAPGSGTTNVVIGIYGNETTPSGYLSGLIDEGRITADAAYYDAFAPAQHLTALAATAGLWKFDARTLADSTANGLNGTAVSAVAYAEDVPGAKQYAWYQGTSGDLTHPLGSMSPATTVSVAPAATTQYWYQLRDGACTTNSAAGTVNVCVPQITTQPSDKNIVSGNSTTLSAAANTAGVSYQWYAGASGVTSSPVPNGAQASVNVSPTATTTYWVRATSTCGRTADSNIATVTVCQPPTATSQTTSRWVTPNTLVTLSVSGTGSGTLTYQWYTGVSGNTTAPMTDPNATQAAFNIWPAATNSYWARVTGSCGSADSSTITISVCNTPSITTQPSSRTIYYDTTTTLSVVASEGTTTPMTYQWYRGTAGDTSAPVGTNSPSYTTSALSATTNYWVRISAGGCTPADSSTATVTVCSYTATVGTASTQQTSVGQQATVYSPVTGNSYLFYQGASGDTSHPLTGWTTVNSIAVAPTVTTNYWNQVDNGTCIANSATTTVDPCVPHFTSQPPSKPIPTGTSTSISASADTAGVTYQWYLGTSPTTTSPISGATGPSYTTPVLTSNTNYWVRAISACGRTADSNTATITMCTPPSVGQLANASPVYTPGQSATLHINATGTGPLTYQWYKGPSGTTSTPVANATSASLTVTAWQTDLYWVQVTGQCGTPAVNSNGAYITVVPSITQQPVGANVNYGEPMTLTVAASGNYLHYAWYKNNVLISGAPDAPAYTIPSVIDTANYFCSVTSGTTTGGIVAASINSATVTVGTCSLLQYTGQYVWSDGACHRSISVGFNDTPETWAWYQGTRGNMSTLVSTGASPLYVCITGPTSYWVRVSKTDPDTGVICYTDSPTINVQ